MAALIVAASYNPEWSSWSSVALVVVWSAGCSGRMRVVHSRGHGQLFHEWFALQIDSVARSATAATFMHHQHPSCDHIMWQQRE